VVVTNLLAFGEVECALACSDSLNCFPCLGVQSGLEDARMCNIFVFGKHI
jgi:hypothetical protein